MIDVWERKNGRNHEWNMYVMTAVDSSLPHNTLLLGYLHVMLGHNSLQSKTWWKSLSYQEPKNTSALSIIWMGSNKTRRYSTFSKHSSIRVDDVIKFWCLFHSHNTVFTAQWQIFVAEYSKKNRCMYCCVKVGYLSQNLLIKSHVIILITDSFWIR